MAVIAGITLRCVFWLITPVTGDAAFHYTIMGHMADTWSIPLTEHVTGPNPFWYPPLFHIVGAIVKTVTGWAELTPLLFGILGLLAFKRFAQVHYPDNAKTSMWVLALLPFHVYYSGIGYMTTFLFLLTVMAFYHYMNYRKGGSARELLRACAFCALSAATHYHGFIPLLALSLDLAFRNRKAAVLFFICGLLLVSPVYVRNYWVFGNPFWPKLQPGNFPGDKAVEHVNLTPGSLLSPRKVSVLVFEFWLGAPNSGDDLAKSWSLGRDRFPLFDLMAFGWVLAVILGTIMGLRGLKGLDAEDRRLALIIGALCIGPYINNGMPRFWVALAPLAYIGLAKTYDGVKFKGKWIATLFCIVALLGASYAYAFSYRKIRDSYEPFWNMMEANIQDTESVVMPFNIADCNYQTGLRCIRIGSLGGIAEPGVGQVRSVMEENGIDAVCCSSLAWDGYGESDKRICTEFAKDDAFIVYDRGPVWGRCWKAGLLTAPDMYNE